MTTAVGNDFTAPLLGGREHFLLRRLHSLTGIVFGGYLIVHLVVNSTLAQRGIYQISVNKIHQIVWLPVVEWVFIYLPILFHTIYGIWIILTGQPNNSRYTYAKNWFYLFQRISGVYIAAFLFFHVLSLKYGLFGDKLRFDPHNAQRTIVIHMHTAAAAMWIVYILGIVCSAYHTANGFWTAGVSWGLTVSAGAQRRWGWVCLVLGVGLLVAGMVALIAAGTQAVPPPLPTTAGMGA